LIFRDCEGEDFTLTVEGYNPWGVLGLWRWSFPVKLALSYTNIMVILISIIVVVLVIFGIFKFFIKRI